jgi:polyisoprenoid-binding protein YceI
MQVILIIKKINRKMNTKKNVWLAAFLTLSIAASAQKIYTKNGSISFFSKSSLENITADNNQVMSVLNLQTGELQYSVIIKSFRFKKALMEEHFNDNYLESNKYPKASFKGNISNFKNINLNKDGSFPIQVLGELTMHGISNKVSAQGSLVVKSGIPNLSGKLSVKLVDYKIEVPKLVKDNIAEVIEITVTCTYDQKI